MERLRTVAILVSLAWAAVATALPAQAAEIVAAETFYGDVAARIAGPSHHVTSIITSPDQDPHDFEPTASTARAIAGAALLIHNGAGYDPWVDKLAAASPSKTRAVVNVARLVGWRSGGNPHLWYDPATMPKVARAVADRLAAMDPAGAEGYRARLDGVLQALQPIEAKVADIKAKHAGAEVTATEPVFGLMAAALGLKMRNERFQTAVMNETEPSARDVAAFQDDLRSKRVKVLFYNSQVSGGIAETLLAEAKAAGVPVVGVTETQPPGTAFDVWMLNTLAAVESALGEAR